MHARRAYEKDESKDATKSDRGEGTNVNTFTIFLIKIDENDSCKKFDYFFIILK